MSADYLKIIIYDKIAIRINYEATCFKISKYIFRVFFLIQRVKIEPVKLSIIEPTCVLVICTALSRYSSI